MIGPLDASDVDGGRDGGLVDGHDDGRGEGGMGCGCEESGRLQQGAYIDAFRVCYGDESAG